MLIGSSRVANCVGRFTRDAPAIHATGDSILEPLIASLMGSVRPCLTGEGDNNSYSMTDIGMGAFGIFLMQSLLFLSHNTAEPNV